MMWGILNTSFYAHRTYSFRPDRYIANTSFSALCNLVARPELIWSPVILLPTTSASAASSTTTTSASVITAPTSSAMIAATPLSLVVAVALLSLSLFLFDDVYDLIWDTKVFDLYDA